ncbi:peptide chain release factor N(5)-glutamine methyltransferase [Effusibacillus dendaii]|uniref:Release factor glutamine methyltransferase n=1 Tax=Effusibacillus dendaii TaxID=2743772 RepID=A0A7I8DBW7_9BACL|nr:peptide chain release factor N(5)-glutamine methyltransferase [Effusibacillus dendaii]BCJ87658.1 release factor glutamine methyltransferase [Effusibacillus dendaii]
MSLHKFEWSAKSTIREALQTASLLFGSRGVEYPRLQAEVLLQHLLGFTKVKLLTEDQLVFPIDKRDLFEDWVDRRLRGEPLQYIIGLQEFYGRDFKVNPSVLIPRPETEILVEEVLKRKSWWGKESAVRPVIADVGTGSGAIAVTLAIEWKEAAVYSVDISPDAIRTARENADRLRAEVRFLEGDLLQPLIDRQIRLDVLVSNPPYIPSVDIAGLAVEVREHEPRLALDGGKDGLDPYRKMAERLPTVMNQTGPRLVAFEVGFGQAEEVKTLLEQNWPDCRTEIVNDLQGIGRVVLAWRQTQ